MKNQKRILGIIFLVAVLVGGLYISSSIFMGERYPQTREGFISLRDGVRNGMMDHGKYACCLEKPCTYCIEKTPGHGEGASCNCLKDVVEGKHPCGECIGEILEGHGNKYLAKYFARAISDETGEKEAIKRIISDKYGISLEDQLYDKNKSI